MPTDMGFGTPPATMPPSLWERIQAGLLGPSPAYGGLVDEEARKAAQRQGLLALGAQLMSAGGPSSQRVSFGQALGPALMAGQQAQQQGVDSALQALLLKQKLQPPPKQPKRYVVKGALVDENGNPVYTAPESATGGGIGNYQPGDYTPASWAKFTKSKDPADLERYVTPRQEYSPSFQNVTKVLPDGSTQQGTFDTRTGAYNWNGEIVPPGAKSKAEAGGREAGKITGQREAKAPIAYATFQTGIAGLENAMAGSATGPIAGRIPAVTAAQQIAEGAQATMAPVLKQLFRDSGEGTFTDADQALLMQMVPSRTDHPEARKAKIQMIDSIVRAKLGLDTSQQPTGAGNRPVDIGQSTTINGVKVRRVR